MAHSPKWIWEGKDRAKASGKRLEEPLGEGLYLVTQPSGNQSFAYRYASPITHKPVKLTLGAVNIDRKLELGEAANFDDPDGLTNDMAVTLAKWCRSEVKAKRDPTMTRDRRRQEVQTLSQLTFEGPIFDTLIIDFMESYPPVRASRPATEATKKQTALFLGLKPDGKGGWQANGNGLLSKWAGKVFASHDGTPKLTRRDAYEALKPMKPVTANRTLSALKLFGRWCVAHEHLTANPFAEMTKPHGEEPRDRTLTPEEIKTLWKTIEEADESSPIKYPYGRMAQLCLVTACREWQELGKATWADVDLEGKVLRIPRGRTKNKKDAYFKVPLTDLALKVIDSLPRKGKWLFSSITDDDKPVRKETAGKRFKEPKDFTYHDLRRTAYTAIMETHGYVVADMVTGHALPPMAQTYGSGAEMGDWKRKALESWEARLKKIIS